MAPTRVHLSMKSSNEKTGPIPVSTTERDTCATDCPFKGNGCYAENFRLKSHWDAVSRGERGTDWQTFVDAIRNLPEGQLWRHNQAGDLPGNGRQINRAELSALVDANGQADARGFTYTHYTMDLPDNRQAVKEANAFGFTINLSGNNPAHADTLADLGIAPVVTVLPIDYQRRNKGGEWLESMAEYKARLATLPDTTPAGRKVVVCPATDRDDVSCATCGLCAVANRKVIVGFPAHGASKLKASAVAAA